MIDPQQKARLVAHTHSCVGFTGISSRESVNCCSLVSHHPFTSCAVGKKTHQFQNTEQIHHAGIWTHIAALLFLYCLYLVLWHCFLPLWNIKAVR